MSQIAEIVLVDQTNLRDAAYVHAVSWQESHNEICSPAFVAAHTTQRQMQYLLEEHRRGKSLFLLFCSADK